MCNFFVSTEGNDANPGTDRQPFRTILKARDAARNSGCSRVTVLVKGGIYQQEKSLVFTHEDSNTTYRAWGNEEVIISGGRNIPGPWEKDGDILYTDLETPLEYCFTKLYSGREERQRARKPNYDPEKPNRMFHRAGRVDDAPKNAFRYRKGDIEHYNNLDDVVINFYHMWLAAQKWITDLDEENNTVYFESRTVFSSIDHPKFVNPRGRYYLENALEFLDTPGEWYLDRKTSRLYYMPFPNEDPETLILTAPVMSKLVKIEGSATKPVKNLAFDGITFMHTDWNIQDRKDTDMQAHETLGDAMIFAEYAHDCGFTDCEMTLGGSHGIFFSHGCLRNTVQKCHIHNFGGGGVYIGPHGCRRNYIAGEGDAVEYNVVDNCFIHDLSHFFHGSCNVWIGCSNYNRISHNELSDNDYCGVSAGWSWQIKGDSEQHHNIIEKNHIHHLGHGEISDFGGIYTLGFSPGTEVRDNVIHHMYAHGKSWGIYLDEGSRGITVKRNLVFKTNDRAFLNKNGPNMILENIFAYPGNNVLDTFEDKHGGATFTFSGNIVLTDTPAGKVKELMNRWHINEISFDNNVYWDISNNELFMFHDEPFEKWQEQGYDLHSVVADPEFSVAVPDKTEDFAVSASSPARKLGYDSDPGNPIDFSTAGLYGNDEWRSLPERYTPRFYEAVYSRLDQ